MKTHTHAKQQQQQQQQFINNPAEFLYKEMCCIKVKTSENKATAELVLFSLSIFKMLVIVIWVHNF